METNIKTTNFNLGHCRVDLSDNSICFEGQEKLSLQPKFIEVLAQLALGYPGVVTREQLIESVWDGNEYVGSKALTNAIWHLRQQLEPLSQDTVIETVRKAGYRLLVAPVFDEVSEQDEEPVEVSYRRFRYLSWSIGTAGTLLLCLMSWWLFTGAAKPGAAVLKYLTRDDGSERFPKVSPDGKYLVYGASSQGGNYSLFIKDMEQEDAVARRLTSRDSNEYRAVWHPEGESLYFPSRRAEDGRCFLTEMTVNTGHLRFLTACNTRRAALDISPDGKELAYIHRMSGERQDEVYRFRLDQNDAVPEKINCVEGCSGSARDLAYSTDGRYIAVARRLSNISEDIFLYERSTGIEKALTQGMEDIRGLTWHHDARQLVFGVESSGVRRGFHLDMTSLKVSDLDVQGVSYPSFIPGSDDLVYSSYARQYDVAYMDLDEKIPQTPYPLFYSGYSQRLPDYSPVTGRVVYTSNETGFNEIWSSDGKGRNRIQHTVMERRALFPRWSADGKKIAFIAPDEMNEGNQIHVLDLASGELGVISSPYSNHTRLFWGPGDKAIYSSVNDAMVKFTFDGKAPLVMEELDFVRGQVVGDRELIFSRDDVNGLWKLDIQAYEAALNAGNELPQPVALLRGRSSGVDWGNAPKGVVLSDKFNWTATETHVYFKERLSSRQYMVSALDRESNTSKGVLRLPSSFLSSFGTMSYIPERDRLLMTLTDYPQRDVMLLRHPVIN
ncbi:winged helix-turn-helix transcriptional regulator [Shewanella submarina]|uniref:Winged helix-turn-helix domain-containing protein n=1 Tax=Shewanella submarina TaxID=2016376 RepID=A0ABV7G837_9GAMM|nr:winged helix-turn-helix domain-containing protein [Shewanella submarina]MCL1036954.1 winged helix-turn-helix transcriptional regulator [Shewanella submarina]